MAVSKKTFTSLLKDQNISLSFSDDSEFKKELSLLSTAITKINVAIPSLDKSIKTNSNSIDTLNQSIKNFNNTMIKNSAALLNQNKAYVSILPQTNNIDFQNLFKEQKNLISNALKSIEKTLEAKLDQTFSQTSSGDKWNAQDFYSQKQAERLARVEKEIKSYDDKKENNSKLSTNDKEKLKVLKEEKRFLENTKNTSYSYEEPDNKAYKDFANFMPNILGQKDFLVDNLQKFFKNVKIDLDGTFDSLEYLTKEVNRAGSLDKDALEDSKTLIGLASSISAINIIADGIRSSTANNEYLIKKREEVDTFIKEIADKMSSKESEKENTSNDSENIKSKEIVISNDQADDKIISNDQTSVESTGEDNKPIFDQDYIKSLFTKGEGEDNKKDIDHTTNLGNTVSELTNRFSVLGELAEEFRIRRKEEKGKGENADTNLIKDYEDNIKEIFEFVKKEALVKETEEGTKDKRDIFQEQIDKFKENSPYFKIDDLINAKLELVEAYENIERASSEGNKKIIEEYIASLKDIEIAYIKNDDSGEGLSKAEKLEILKKDLGAYEEKNKDLFIGENPSEEILKNKNSKIIDSGADAVPTESSKKDFKKESEGLGKTIDLLKQANFLKEQLGGTIGIDLSNTFSEFDNFLGKLGEIKIAMDSGLNDKEKIHDMAIAGTQAALSSLNIVNSIIKDASNAAYEKEMKKAEEDYTKAIVAAEEEKQTKLDAIAEDRKVYEEELAAEEEEERIEKEEEEYEKAQEKLDRDLNDLSYKLSQETDITKQAEIEKEMEAKKVEKRKLEEEKKQKELEEKKQKEKEDKEKDFKQKELTVIHEYEVAKVKAENQRINDEYQAKKKKAENDKLSNIMEVTMSTAMGIAGLWSRSLLELGTIAGPIMAGILTATMLGIAGTQIAKISSQPLPKKPDEIKPPEKLSVKLAKGGIVRSSQNFQFGRPILGQIGEAGPEAIIPLNSSSIQEFVKGANIVNPGSNKNNYNFNIEISINPIKELTDDNVKNMIEKIHKGLKDYSKAFSFEDQDTTL